MAVGYPDYTRIARAGNQQLYFTATSIPNNLQLFKGYVGSWPYTIIFCDMGSTTDNIRIEMLYYSDATFTTQVGFRYSIRTGANFSCISYGNISDWMILQAHTKSGASFPVVTFGVYATMGASAQYELDSTDVPLANIRFTVSANSTAEFQILHVHPGNARFIMNSAVTSWQWKLRYFDYGSNAITTIAQSPTLTTATTIAEDLPQIDAPMYIDLVNSTAAAGLFLGTLLSKSP